MPNSARRSFLKLAVATTGVYVVGQAVKSLDGSLVAGAKGCFWYTSFAAPEYACGNVGMSLPPPPTPCSLGDTYGGCDIGSPGIITEMECLCY